MKTSRAIPVALLVAVAMVAGAFGVVPPPQAAAAQETEETSSTGVDCRQVEGLTAHGETGGRDAVLMIHGWTGEPDMWKKRISSAVDQNIRPVGVSFADQVKRFGDTDVWLLDYHRYSGRWVTDDRVGGAVARSIDCLFEQYGRPIGIAAHSMGGLAVRQVASDEGRADRIAAVVTFGTPHTGSDIAWAVAGLLGLNNEPTPMELLQPSLMDVVRNLLRFCGWASTERLGACDPLFEQVAAFNSEAGIALRRGSDGLAELPDYPAGLPTTSLAGELEVVSQATITGGLFYQDVTSVRLGDLVVTSASALARGGNRWDRDCRHNLLVTPTPGVVRDASASIRSWFGLAAPAGNERVTQGALGPWRDVLGSPCAHWNLATTMEFTNEALWFLHEHLQGVASDSVVGTGVVPGTTAEIVRDGASPLMFVVDVSGSMSQDGGQGLSRLDAARDNLTDFLFGLSPGTPVGVRHYPDPTGPDCNPGRSVQPVAPLEASRTVALIDGFRAAGNTPTGPALLAAVDELRASGFTGGEIVLVSDGESNCGEPPCDVVRTIIASGFDVSVNTFGFVISAEGRQELDCIASVSGGTYFDAADAEELGEQLRAITGAALEIEVTQPERVASGTPLTIEVTVRNPSGVLAADVEVAIDFLDAGPDLLQPAAAPARYRVGNLPPGAAVTRRWEVTAGAFGQAGLIDARVTAGAPDVAPVTATAPVEVGGEVPGIGEVDGLLREVHDAGGTIAIMGDSYSAGVGAGAHRSDTDDPDGRCRRSDGTYAVALFGQEAVDLVACAGAAIEHFYQPQPERGATPAQLTALEELGRTPQLVLLTIGLEDVGLAEIVERCVGLGDCTHDAGWVTRVLRDVALLGPRLEQVYADLAARVADEDGRVAVLAYPQVLPARQPTPCTGFTANEVLFADQVIRELNLGIGKAVERARSRGHDVHFVEQSAEAFRPGNTACHPEPYAVAVGPGLEAGVTGWLATHADGKEATAVLQALLHPNAAGYTALTDALTRWSAATIRDGFTPLGSEVDEPSDLVVDGAGRAVDVRLTDDEEPERRVRRGGSIELEADGFVPGSRVSITLGAQPVRLAVLEADADGRVAAEVHLPVNTATGEHPLQASGLDASAEARELTVTLSVLPQARAWFWPAAIGAIVLALLGGVLALVAWRGRRGAPGAG